MEFAMKSTGENSTYPWVVIEVRNLQQSFTPEILTCQSIFGADFDRMTPRNIRRMRSLSFQMGTDWLWPAMFPHLTKCMVWRLIYCRAWWEVFFSITSIWSLANHSLKQNLRSVRQAISFDRSHTSVDQHVPAYFEFLYNCSYLPGTHRWYCMKRTFVVEKKIDSRKRIELPDVVQRFQFAFRTKRYNHLRSDDISIVQSSEWENQIDLSTTMNHSIDIGRQCQVFDIINSEFIQRNVSYENIRFWVRNVDSRRDSFCNFLPEIITMRVAR